MSKKTKSDYCTRVRRLRLFASRIGLEVVQPMFADQRKIAGTGPFLLVPSGSGIALEEAERVVQDKINAGAELAPLAAVTKRCGIHRETTLVFRSTGYMPEKDDDRGEDTRH